MLKRKCLDGKENRKVFFHPYIPATVNQVERWLTEVAYDGWKLIDKKGWMFYFIKSKKKERQFFMYSGFDLTPGIAYDYLRAKDIYAKSKSKSKIYQRTFDIFEVDTERIDDGFYQYRRLRNQYYRKHYCKFAVFCTVFIAAAIVFSFFNSWFWIVGVPYLVWLIYAVASIITLTRFMK